MAKRSRKVREDDVHAKFRAASGWYLAAWRDKRGLTLEELAEEVGTSRGVVSDLETGAFRKNGAKAQRFNRDDVEKFAAALGTTGGFLIDVNPFENSLKVELAEKAEQLDERDLELANDFLASLLARSGRAA